jgi:histone acetyltransferase MYST1
MCTRRVGLAEIIDVRPDPRHPRHYEYYVHYRGFDKRLDEWAPVERFVRAYKDKACTVPLADTERTLTRHLRKQMLSTLAPSPTNCNSAPPRQALRPASLEVDPEYEKLEREHEEATKVKNIQRIEIGPWEIDCWYFSPFPDEYCHQPKLFICERCLKYMRHQETLARHQPGCPYSGPPGAVVYLKDNVVVYEVDGEGPGKLYCQNMSLMAKLFLDHKTLYYDVAPFKFYVLCELGSPRKGGDGNAGHSNHDHNDDDSATYDDESEDDGAGDNGVHPVGYFSKEKESPDNYNLACIMILPPYQRHGYGRFLIELSYELTKLEGRLGSPEKPLSDLGMISYRSYWTQAVLEAIRLYHRRTRGVLPLLPELSKLTGMTRVDVVDTLMVLGLTKVQRGGDIILNVQGIQQIEQLLSKYSGRKQVRVDPDYVSYGVRSKGRSPFKDNAKVPSSSSRTLIRRPVNPSQ